MKIFEEIEFQIPTSDVQKKDFRKIFEMALLTAAALATMVLINIIFN